MYPVPLRPEECITGNRILALCHKHGIPYAKTDFLGEALPDAQKAGVLVTHNGGFNILDHGQAGWYQLATAVQGYGAFRLPDGIRWWCTNAEGGALHGLPLGLDNIEVPECGRGSKHFTTPPDGSPAGQMVIERMNRMLPKRGHLYLKGVRLDTNPAEREACVAALKDKPWVTYRPDRIPFDQWLDELQEHEFVASPAGNGIDCHRSWEALYLGTVPIVRPYRSLTRFASLPIMFLDDWTKLHRHHIDEMYARILSRGVNIDMLRLSYWEEQICQSR